jgi:hypothetical protein
MKSQVSTTASVGNNARPMVLCYQTGSQTSTGTGPADPRRRWRWLLVDEIDHIAADKSRSWGSADNYNHSHPFPAIDEVTITITPGDIPEAQVLAGCSIMATTLVAMKRPVRTGWPDRVTSVTSTLPRAVEISTRRPALVAAISKRWTAPPPTSTRTSTRSPFIVARL